MAVTQATVTHMIKMGEPLCTLVFVMMWSGKQSVDLKLILIVVFAVMFAFGSESYGEQVLSTPWGIILALGSNACYALRNIGAKYDGSTTLHGFTKMSFYGLLSLAPMHGVALLMSKETYLYPMPDILSCISSLAHCGYSFVSLAVILSMFDPVEHAMLNTSKRLTLVVSFYFLSASHWAYLNIAFAMLSISLNIYGANYKNEASMTTTKALIKVMVLGALVFSCLHVVENPTAGEQPTYNHSRGKNEDWKFCIHKIQNKITTTVSEFLSKNPIDQDIPTLYVDPSYHGNLGDTFIAYGSLVLMEKLGFKHHVECGILQSGNKNQGCGDFKNYPNGTGIAFVHGGKLIRKLV